jgi:hypothetical protein
MLAAWFELLEAKFQRPLITPMAFRSEFGNDNPQELSYNTFLPFLGQMADRRAFEQVVFLVSELPAGRPMSCELKAAGVPTAGIER